MKAINSFTLSKVDEMKHKHDCMIAVLVVLHYELSLNEEMILKKSTSSRLYRYLTCIYHVHMLYTYFCILINSASLTFTI